MMFPVRKSRDLSVSTATRRRVIGEPGRVMRTALGLAWLALSASAGAIDWTQAQAREVTVFLPGQMSWEKTLTAATHKGAKKIREGQSCLECHADEEADLGSAQAGATGFGGRSAAKVMVRAALSGADLHLQLVGDTIDGKAPDIALLIGGDALRSTAQAGCWGACHDDAPGMASDTGLNLGKYLPRSRSKNTATGGGSSVRPAAELDSALQAGEFLDLLELDAAGKAVRGYVLEKLHETAAPVRGSMTIEGSRWVAEISRPLAATGAGQLALQGGGTYYMGLALHDPGREGHDHLVSLVVSLAIESGAADLVAKLQ